MLKGKLRPSAISPGSLEPKKTERETLDYPSKSLANLNRGSRDLNSTRFVGVNYCYVSLSWGKKKSRLIPLAFGSPLAFPRL